MSADVSIVVPVYQRGEILRYTFESIRRASSGVEVETIVVDDGSEPPAEATLARLGIQPSRLLRQPNRGLLFARLAGLTAATGRHVLFLDSDDLITPDHLVRTVAALDSGPADVAYTDTARAVLDGPYDRLATTLDAPLAAVSESPDFFIDVQPAPHSPVFRREFLLETVASALFPPSPLYNPVAEIWFYHIASPRPARVVHVPGPRAIVGQHPTGRLTNHWERLAVASLAVMEAFARTCTPSTPLARRARQRVGEKAFRAWRGLPEDFSPEFARRELALWSTLAAGESGRAPGSRLFRLLAAVLGPVRAGSLLKRRNASYQQYRTLTDGEFAALLRALPPP